MYKLKVLFISLLAVALLVGCGSSVEALEEKLGISTTADRALAVVVCKDLDAQIKLFLDPEVKVLDPEVNFQNFIFIPDSMEPAKVLETRLAYAFGKHESKLMKIMESSTVKLTEFGELFVEMCRKTDPNFTEIPALVKSALYNSNR